MMLDFLKCNLLNLADTINVVFNPHDKFTRVSEAIDPKTLKQKEEHYWAEIQQKFLEGPNKEFFWSMRPNDLGDMAIWQGLYVLACSLKGDKTALSRAFDGLSLLQILGGDNRLARGADKDGGNASIDPTRTYFKDQGYIYIQEVSESTLIGQLLGYWSVIYLRPESSFAARAELLVEKLANQVIADDFQLRDHNGTPARFGDLRLSNATAPIRIASLACLMYMAYKATRSKKYGDIYQDIVKKYQAALSHPETHFLWIHPQYQDILAYFVLLMLYTMEEDHRQAKKYRETLGRQWEKNCEEGNSFYTYITELICGDVEKRQLEKAAQILHEFNTDPDLGPLGKGPGFRSNVNRPHFKWGFKFMNGGKLEAKQPVPPYLRPGGDIIWQRNPYGLSGNADHHYTGLDFVVAAQLGLYCGALHG